MLPESELQLDAVVFDVEYGGPQSIQEVINDRRCCRPLSQTAHSLLNRPGII